MKKLIAIILIPCVILGVGISVWLVSRNSNTEPDTSNIPPYEAEPSFVNGQILQCWNWSFQNIKDNLDIIFEQGFSAIQTSPIQGIKQSTKESSSTVSNSWWLYYEPINFNVETNSYNALGTFAEFKAMCEEAEKYGIKVIVDVVLNHTANNGASGSISSLVPESLRNDMGNWHDLSKNSWNETRWDITQFSLSGKADLNTSSSTVQECAINFLKECIDLGADGFCFNKAKNIEVPADGKYASDFWPNVINETTKYAQSTKGFTPYYYGELVDGPSGFGDKENAQIILDSYMSFMNVAQNSVSDSIRNAIVNGDALGASRTDFYFADGSKSLGNKSILLPETYETYMSGTSSVDIADINKAWALLGSRKNVVGLYFARPSDINAPIGSIGIEGWSNEETRVINQFKSNYMGQVENVSASGSIVINERGTSGAVIVNCGGTSDYVNIKVNMLVNGTYVDELTGNIFTVYNGHVEGEIGLTGIAVITQDSTAKPDESVPPESSVRIYFNNNSYGWNTVYAYVYNNTLKNEEWPGVEMEYDDETGYYFMDLTGELANGNVVFTENKDSTTNRYPPLLQDGLAINGTDMIFDENHTWKEYSETEPPIIEEPASFYIYFDNSFYNWSKVYAYAYSDTDENASWPGVEMELDSDTGYYKIGIGESLKNGKIIFTESENATTNRYPSSMLAGLTLEGKGMLFSKDNVWTEFSPSEVIIYFDNSSYKWSKVYAYVYNDLTENAKWPGVEMTYDKSLGYYKLELSGDLATKGKVLFSEHESAYENRYPAAGEKGLDIGGKNMIFASGHSWNKYIPKNESVGVNSAITVYFDNSSYKWSKVYAYVYNDTTENAKWPGVEMTYDKKMGYYKLELVGELSKNGKVLFTENADSFENRYPAQGETGLSLSGKDMIFSTDYSWKEYIPVFLPSNAKYSVKGDFLLGVTEKTKVSTLISSFKFNNISVVNHNNKKVSSSAYVGTGYKIRLMKNGKIIDSHIIVVCGDVDGNCVVNSSDYLKIKRELIGKYSSKDAYILAADIDQNKKIDNEDCLKLKMDFLSD